MLSGEMALISRTALSELQTALSDLQAALRDEWPEQYEQS
jgi:hypothetical protein